MIEVGDVIEKKKKEATVCYTTVYNNQKYIVDTSSNIVNNSQITTVGKINTITIPKNILEDNSNYEIILINKV